MPKTLLIGNPATTWRAWLKQNRADRDLLCLDPADPQQGLPGRLTLWRGNKILHSRFFGSLDPQRAPHVIVATLADALRRTGDDLIVQMFAYRQSPMLRQVTHLCAELFLPDHILVAEGTPVEAGWPVTPTDIALDIALPWEVQVAQRKALWLRLFENCHAHELDLRTVTIDGARLGSGRPLPYEERVRCHLDTALHAEKVGKTLVAVVEQDPEESLVSLALHATGCVQANFIHAEAYQGLFCSFARQDGEDFGYGVIQSIDWREMRAQIECDAIPPAPVRTLRMGGIRVGPDGDEWSEVRPWQV